jgi:hypothetical protein
MTSANVKLAVAFYFVEPLGSTCATSTSASTVLDEDEAFIIGEEDDFSPPFFFDDSFLLVCCVFCLFLFLESSDSCLWLDNMASAIFNTAVNEMQQIKYSNLRKNKNRTETINQSK